MIPIKHHKHPCLKLDSNPQTTVPNGSALPFVHPPANHFCKFSTLFLLKVCDWNDFSFSEPFLLIVVLVTISYPTVHDIAINVTFVRVLTPPKLTIILIYIERRNKDVNMPSRCPINWTLDIKGLTKKLENYFYNVCRYFLINNVHYKSILT